MSVLAILKSHALAIAASTLTNPTRLLTPDPKETAFMTAAGTASIDIDLGAVKIVNAIFLNAVLGAQSFTVTGGAAAYTTTAVADLVVAPKYSGLAPRKNLITFADQSWRYIRLTGALAPINFSIGNLLVGDAFRPTWGHQYGGGRGVGDTGAASRLLSGGFGINPGARFKTWDFKLGDLTDAEIDELYDLALSVGETSPIMVCEDADITANLDARIHYGLFGKIDKFARLIPGATEWGFKVEEWV